jgi:molybdopterin-guanine dinucleotide biosynthesis protein
LSREISRIADASVTEMLALSDAAVATGRRIGVTGPPGAGKSSLIARLVRQRLERAGDIAVIAVDPTSPVSGGAILGDRIRMEELATDPRVYIRSLASRHSLDGLADNLPSVLGYLETAGFTELVIETVGVGQVEYEIRSLVDTLLDGSGDPDLVGRSRGRDGARRGDRPASRLVCAHGPEQGAAGAAQAASCRQPDRPAVARGFAGIACGDTGSASRRSVR